MSKPGCGLSDEDLDAMSDADAVVHCAGLTDFQPDPVKGLAANVDGAIYAADLAASLTVPRLIHVSTCYVTGTRNGEIEEVLRDTNPNASDALGGRGINVENAIAGGMPSMATISGSLVERSFELSLAVLGSDAQIVGTLVRDNRLQVPSGLAGRGITIQASTSNGERSTATVVSSLIENSGDAGILVGGADATVDSVVVRETAGDGTGSFGDGVLVTSDLGATTLNLRGSAIENSVRAGLSTFSGHVTLADTTLSCQAFDIASETIPGSVLEPIVENLGGNACGCPAEPDACKTATAGIQPPSPLD